MIYPPATTTGFSWVAMPFWQWLPVSLPVAVISPLPEALLAPVRAALAEVAALGEKAAGYEPPAEPEPEHQPLAEMETPAAPEPPSLELVFQGYQWQLRAQWYPFVNPAWDHFVDNDPADIQARGIRQERERADAARHAVTRRGW